MGYDYMKGNSSGGGGGIRILPSNATSLGNPLLTNQLQANNKKWE